MSNSITISVLLLLNQTGNLLSLSANHKLYNDVHWAQCPRDITSHGKNGRSSYLYFSSVTPLANNIQHNCNYITKSVPNTRTQKSAIPPVVLKILVLSRAHNIWEYSHSLANSTSNTPCRLDNIKHLYYIYIELIEVFVVNLLKSLSSVAVTEGNNLE